ncbi:formamidopyrimidine-DNA glycosylase [Colletotrichum kahawae]|uniref:Formamidopyrimidine-DNA glycosylase n=1 Tax=Colletotrichum kahawae TaxID=34407 RepID=A0AAE0D0M6_COLKA|nr:formamidopyrimidine-DNA glycosylase [Colletotrichum kahawae]
MESFSSTAMLYWPRNWPDRETLDLQSLICTVWPQYLTLQEACGILDQFHGPVWMPDKQVLWTGLGQKYALVDSYARERGMQTLRIAMGPLMDPQNPACLQSQKSTKEWGRYIRGASLIFSWRISQGDITTVLTQPPPTRYNPHGRTAYQEIEEPVLKGILGNRPVDRILAAHPTIEQAKTFPPYEIFPNDHQNLWKSVFGGLKCPKHKWRSIDGNIRTSHISNSLPSERLSDYYAALPKWAITSAAYGFLGNEDPRPRSVEIFLCGFLICAGMSSQLSLVILVISSLLVVQGTIGIPSISMCFTEIEPEECCDLKLAIPSANSVFTKGLSEKLETLEAIKNRLEASVSPKAVEVDPPRTSDMEKVAKLVNPAKVLKIKGTAKQAVSSQRTSQAQLSLPKLITPPVNQSCDHDNGEVRPTSKKLSKGKAAAATDVRAESSMQGSNAKSPNEPGAESQKKKQKKKKLDDGENMVAKAKPKKPQDKKVEKENTDCKGKANSQAPSNIDLPTISEKPAVGGTKKKNKGKAAPTKVKGIALTTKISSKGKEAGKSKNNENQPGKSVRPRTSAK